MERKFAPFAPPAGRFASIAAKTFRRIAAMAFLCAAAEFPARSAPVVSDPASPLRIAPLGDISQGVCTNGAPAPGSGLSPVEPGGEITAANAGWQGSPWIPPWWSDYGVSTTNAPDDSAAATRGQLRWMSLKAAEMLDDAAWAEGGAGQDVYDAVSALASGDDFAAATSADLWSAAIPFALRNDELCTDHPYSSSSFPWFSGPSSGSGSNEVVNLGQLKFVFSFDPFIDFDGNGIPDWWERFYGIWDYFHAGWNLSSGFDRDSDSDGLSDAGEWLGGTNPVDRDSDGDGFTDGTDPDPRVLTPWTDSDGNGLPDAWEIHWFGMVDPSRNPSTRDDRGFTLAAAMSAGFSPTNPPFSAWIPECGIECIQMAPPFSVSLAAGSVAWERTFPLSSFSGTWEQLFVSSSTNPAAGSVAGDCGAWSLDGLVLDWSASDGSFGTLVSCPDQFSPARLPIPTNGATSVTLRLRCTSAGPSVSATSLFLLRYVPEIDFPDLPSATDADGNVMFASRPGDTIRFSVDRSFRPSSAALSPEEAEAFPFELPETATLVFDPPPQGGLLPGGSASGSLSFSRAAAFEAPLRVPGGSSPQPIALGPRRSRDAAGPPDRTIALALIDPSISYGTGHSAPGIGLSWDPATGSHSRISDFPLDTDCLWRAFHSDATGAYSCNCTPVLTLGATPEVEHWFGESVAVDGDVATGTVTLGSEEVWTGTARHYAYPAVSVSLGESECGCAGECATCDDVDGPVHSSFGFRLSLGLPRSGQFSGFLWLRTESPFAVSPSSFSVMSRQDAAVSDATDPATGVRTIACSDSRGRTATVFSPSNSAVRIVVTDTASGALDHVWDIVNENGSSSRIRVVKTSRLGNTMSDTLFVHDGIDWNANDMVSGATTDLWTDDSVSRDSDPTYTEERILSDSSGLPLVQTTTVSRRLGTGPGAAMREVSRIENAGTDFEKTAFAHYWEDPEHPRRNATPRLVFGSARAWRWTDCDEDGRLTFSLDQLDGSEVPSGLETGVRWTLQNVPPETTATATVLSYLPLAGDSADFLDDGVPRTVSRYVIREGGAPILVSRTWTVILRRTENGMPVLETRTERAGAQDAAPGDPRNAVSVSTVYDPDRPGVPLVLRGRPLSETDEDGVSTLYACTFGDFSPATVSTNGVPSPATFGPSPSGAFMRTRSIRTTAAAPVGVPGVSTVRETIVDAVRGNEVWTATRALLVPSAEPLSDAALSDPFEWESRVYDEKDRLRSTLFPDGTFSTNAWSCCRLLFSVDRTGFRTDRLASTTTTSFKWTEMESWEDLVWSLDHWGYANPGAFDCHRADNCRVSAHVLDPLGREVSRREAVARRNQISDSGSFTPHYYGWHSLETNAFPHGTSDHRVFTDKRGLVTETERFHSQECEESVVSTRDGTNLLKRVETVSLRGGGTSLLTGADGKWTRRETFSSFDDGGCRIDVSAVSASDVPAFTNSVVRHDFLGRAVFSETPFSRTATTYDGTSSRALSESDAWSGTARTNLYDSLHLPLGSETSGVRDIYRTWFENGTNGLWRVSETFLTDGPETNGVRVSRERLTGLSNALVSERVETADGVSERTFSSFDPATGTTTTTLERPGFNPSVSKSRHGRTFETDSGDGVIRRTAYDPYGRAYATAEINGSGSFWRTVVNRDSAGDEVRRWTVTNGWDMTKYGFATEFAVDRSGNVVSETDPCGAVAVTGRDAEGRIVSRSGPAAIPVRHGYDALGRRTSLETTRDGVAWDQTRWALDAATGLCTNKTYADGSSVRYSYAPDGKPLRTTRASGEWTENSYDSAGRLSSVLTSDGRGAYELGYDSFGRLSAVVDDDSSYDQTFAWNQSGSVTNETWTGIRPYVLAPRVLSRSFDGFGRPTGWNLSTAFSALGGPAHFSGARISYGLDGAVSAISHTNGAGRVLDVEFGYEDGRPAWWSLNTDTGWLDRDVFRDEHRPELVVSAFSSPSGRQSRTTFSWKYDTLGRPTFRTLQLPGDPSVATNAYAYDSRGEVTNAARAASSDSYAYDSIGNRLFSSDLFGPCAYDANSVNEYAAVTNLAATPPEAEEPEWDADGNLTSFGGTTFEWDARGRLVRVEKECADGSVVEVGFTYDWRNRLVERDFTRRVGRTVVDTDFREYVWDDWLLLLERKEDADGGFTDIEYVWGPDLSGTMQGAGGVGGLLAVSVDGDYYFPFYDNNGNVMGYADENRSCVARYDYDAFGNLVASSGPMADFFPHRFSTKYLDPDLGLYYYGYRWYSPELGRWISRDPIGEEGGDNLMVFLYNAPTTNYDVLGERQGKWPDSWDKDGFAFVGNVNFPGPGWGRKITFRTRPTTLFDLAAKIHDLHYSLNGLEFGRVANTLGHLAPQLSHINSAELSRKAKSDYIFKMMNRFHWEGGRWSGVLNFLSRQVFYGDPKYFCKGDDFANFLRQPESWKLDDPEHLLMIPYSHLVNPPIKSIRSSFTPITTSHSPGPRARQLTASDYDAIAPEDNNPGFVMWAEQIIGATLARIYEITDETDSSFVW